MKFNNKIFGIGLSKTATCSLTSVLHNGFGLNISHNPTRKFKDNLLVVDLTSDTHAISKIEKFLNKKCQLKEIPWKNRR